MSVTSRNRILLLLGHESDYTELPPLVPDGIFLRDLTVVMCSDFNLYNRFISGEDITPVLQQRYDLGFNFLRVWTLFNIPGIGNITDKSDIYDGYDEFIKLCSLYEMYIMFTAYTSIKDYLHWSRLLDALERCQLRNFYIELVNENNHPSNVNYIDTGQFQKPDFCLSSHGSQISGDENPILPIWDIIDYHTNDAPEWQRKVSHNAMEIGERFNKICIASENTRFSDHCDDSELAYQTARAAALLSAGSCFHSTHGKDSTLWTGLELDNATLWARGANSVPLRYRKGFYRHRIDLESHEILRAYSRTLGSNDEFIVKIKST